MILDERTEFCDATSVALTAGANAQNIGDIIDLGVARDIGNGEPLYLVISVDTSIITGGAAGTISFLLVSDSTSTIATDGSQTIHFESRSFVTDDDALNDLDAGATAVVVALPWEGRVYERYLGVQARVLTTSTTAGAVSAFLTKDPARWKSYNAPAQA